MHVVGREDLLDGVEIPRIETSSMNRRTNAQFASSDMARDLPVIVRTNRASMLPARSPA